MVWVVGRPQGIAPTGWAAGEGCCGEFRASPASLRSASPSQGEGEGLRDNGGWGFGTGVWLAIWGIMAMLKFEKIGSDEEHDAAMVRIDEIFLAPVGSAEGEELEVLVGGVEAWEGVRYPIRPPDAGDVREFRVEQEGVG